MAGVEPKDVFLCHTGADKDWVRSLAERLEAQKIEGRPIAVFFDDWDIDLGENILAHIEKGLEASRLLAVVLSPALTRADWPRLEWQSQVHADPAGRLARIIPILRNRNDPETGEPLAIPLPLRILKWIDFSDDRRFEQQLDVLLRRIRGERPRRGALPVMPQSASSELSFQAYPDARDETIYSNLFPVALPPRHIWSDLTTAAAKRDVWAAYPGKNVPPFAIHAEHLYSFVSPGGKDNPFKPFLTGLRPLEEDPAGWLRDGDRARILIGLCNAAVRDHCFRLRIHVAKEGTRRRFFCPVFGETRTFRWTPRARPRTLGVLKARPTGEMFGVHQAARIAFVLLGERLYLLIEPTYVFTSDGKTPLQGKQIARYYAAWGGRERNAAVFRNVVMWARLLAEGGTDITVSLGAESITVRGVPARADIGHGIAGDDVAVEQLFGGSGGGEEDREADAELERVAVLEMAGLFDDEVEEKDVGDVMGDADDEEHE